MGACRQLERLDPVRAQAVEERTEVTDTVEKERMAAVRLVDRMRLEQRSDAAGGIGCDLGVGPGAVEARPAERGQPHVPGADELQIGIVGAEGPGIGLTGVDPGEAGSEQVKIAHIGEDRVGSAPAEADDGGSDPRQVLGVGAGAGPAEDEGSRPGGRLGPGKGHIGVEDLDLRVHQMEKLGKRRRIDLKRIA